MKAKIFNWLGTGRNFGDLAIQYALSVWLGKAMGGDSELQLIHMSSHLLMNAPVVLPAPIIDIEMVDFINKNCQMLLVGGGGQIMSRHKKQSVTGWQFNITPEALDALKVPLVVCSIGYNKFKYEPDFLNNAKESLQAVAAKAKLFTVRNAATQKALAGIDVESRIVPDIALVTPAEAPSTDKFMSDVKFIMVNYAGDAKDKRYKNPKDEFEFKTYLGRLIHELSALDPSLHFLFVPHNVFYDYEGFEIISSFVQTVRGRQVPLKHLPDLIPSMYPENLISVPKLAGIYQMAHAAIGMRGHANIIPIGQGTPSYGLGGAPKVESFHSDVGWGGKLTGRADFDAQAIYRQAIVEGAATRAAITKATLPLKEQIGQLMLDIVSLL